MTEGERRGLGTQLGRTGWYGIGKGRKGREGNGRNEDDLAPQQNSWIRHCGYMLANGIIFDLLALSSTPYLVNK
jgi:hypothetical protein